MKFANEYLMLMTLSTYMYDINVGPTGLLLVCIVQLQSPHKRAMAKTQLKFLLFWVFILFSPVTKGK